MIAPAAVIETARLTLRAVTLDDAPAIFDSIAKDREVARFMSYKVADGPDDTLTFVRHAADAWRNPGEESDFVYAVRDRATNLVGCCSAGPHAPGRLYHWGIGYNFARAHWGRGYATETVTALAQTVLALPGIFRVSAVVDLGNPASARVLEKSGFQREGLLRRYALHPNAGADPRDVWVYARVC